MELEKKLAMVEAGLRTLEANRALFDAIDHMFAVETPEGEWPGCDQLYRLTDDDYHADAIFHLVDFLGNTLLGLQGSVEAPELLKLARRLGPFTEWHSDNEIVADEHDWK